MFEVQAQSLNFRVLLPESIQRVDEFVLMYSRVEHPYDALYVWVMGTFGAK